MSASRCKSRGAGEKKTMLMVCVPTLYEVQVYGCFLRIQTFGWR